MSSMASITLDLTQSPSRRSKPSRLRRILVKQVFRMRRDLVLAAGSMLGFTAADLLAPWPLKIIVDHVLLSRPLPHSLAWLQVALEQGPVFAVVATSLLILLLAVLRGMFAYAQLYLTSRIGYEMVHTL